MDPNSVPDTLGPLGPFDPFDGLKPLEESQESQESDPAVPDPPVIPTGECLVCGTPMYVNGYCSVSCKYSDF